MLIGLNSVLFTDQLGTLVSFGAVQYSTNEGFGISCAAQDCEQSTRRNFHSLPRNLIPTVAVAGESRAAAKSALVIAARCANIQLATSRTNKHENLGADFKENFIFFGKKAKLPPKGRWWSSLCGAEQGSGRGVLDEELLDRAGGELGSGTSYRL